MEPQKNIKFPTFDIWKNPILLNKIKSGGQKTFNQILTPKTKEGKTPIEVINEYFEPYGLEYVVPDIEFINKNIEDIKFALQNLSFKENVRDKIVEKLDFLEFQKKSHEDFEKGDIKRPGKYFLFFHEKKGGWSIVNLFNDNVKLWIELMKKHSSKYDGDIVKFIDNYFNSRDALKDLVQAMIDRAQHGEKTISRTWGSGTKVETEFYDTLINKFNLSPNQVKKFSGGGNVIDLIGVDFSLFCKNLYISIQVKSDLESALKSIPFNGVSVYPNDGTFFFVRKKIDSPQPIEKLISEICK